MSYNNLKIIEALSPRECVEARLRAAEKLHKGYANVEAVLTKPEGSYLLKERIYGANLVTTAGDTYYAQLGAGDTPTNNFADGTAGRLTMRTGSATPAKGHTYTNVTTPVAHHQTLFTGYPKQADDDADNTASTADKAISATWRYDHGTSVANATNILGGAIHNGGGSPAGGTALLTHFDFSASFTKTSSDTLKVIINHKFLGA